MRSRCSITRNWTPPSNISANSRRCGMNSTRKSRTQTQTSSNRWQNWNRRSDHELLFGLFASSLSFSLFPLPLRPFRASALPSPLLSSFCFACCPCLFFAPCLRACFSVRFRCLRLLRVSFAGFPLFLLGSLAKRVVPFRCGRSPPLPGTAQAHSTADRGRARRGTRGVAMDGGSVGGRVLRGVLSRGAELGKRPDGR